MSRTSRGFTRTRRPAGDGMPTAAWSEAAQVIKWFQSLDIHDLHAVAEYAYLTFVDAYSTQRVMLADQTREVRMELSSFADKLDTLERVRHFKSRDPGCLDGIKNRLQRDDPRVQALDESLYAYLVAIAARHTIAADKLARRTDSMGRLGGSYVRIRGFHADYQACNQTEKDAILNLLPQVEGEARIHVARAVRASAQTI